MWVCLCVCARAQVRFCVCVPVCVCELVHMYTHGVRTIFLCCQSIKKKEFILSENAPEIFSNHITSSYYLFRYFIINKCLKSWKKQTHTMQMHIRMPVHKGTHTSGNPLLPIEIRIQVIYNFIKLQPSSFGWQINNASHFTFSFLYLPPLIRNVLFIKITPKRQEFAYCLLNILLIPVLFPSSN